MSPTALNVTAPASSGYLASPESPERRRCWECLRRRLVCDAIKPVCNKCRTAGIVCPGYDDKKPLTWLAPGKVTCRTRRKPRSGETDADSKKPMKPKPKTLRKGLGRVLSEEEQRMFDGVEYILHSDLRTDICDVYEAVQYCELIYHVGINPTGLGSRGVVLNAKNIKLTLYPPDNAVFYPYTRAGHSGNANLFIDQIPLKVVKYLPTSIAHNLVAIVFQHRLHVQMEWKFDCPSAKHAQARLHHHRGISIRALNEDIANAKTQSSDTVLTGVTLLMQSEITSCISPNWKHHATGFLAMLACRGGATGWLKSAGYLRGVLLSFLITMVVANTTSPSFDQVEICSHNDLIAMTEELYPLGLHPSIPCPMPLFLEIIRINHLRDQFSKGLISKEDAEILADEIISRIMDFNSEDCTGFYEAKEQRDLITHMFHSAVAVFGISSLQSNGVLPNTRHLMSLKTGHSDRLYCLLEEMRKHTVLKKSVQWPLIVAGVEAGIRVDKRRLVGELLVDQGKDIGTPLSFHAKTILRKFWDGTNTDWDVCFDQPYALVA